MDDIIFTLGINVHIPGEGTVVSRVQLLCAVVDLPAKAGIMNCIQFNGHYGCSTCLHPGLSVSALTHILHPFNIVCDNYMYSSYPECTVLVAAIGHFLCIINPRRMKSFCMCIYYCASCYIPVLYIANKVPLGFSR